MQAVKHYTLQLLVTVRQSMGRRHQGLRRAREGPGLTPHRLQSMQAQFLVVSADQLRNLSQHYSMPEYGTIAETSYNRRRPQPVDEHIHWHPQSMCCRSFDGREPRDRHKGTPKNVTSEHINFRVWFFERLKVLQPQTGDLGGIRVLETYATLGVAMVLARAHLPSLLRSSRQDPTRRR